METYTFRALETHPETFFEMLPGDWQTEIVPFWEDYKTHAKIYIIEDGTTMLGGGIVFYKSPPNFDYLEPEATAWFEKGYLYLGFIWICAERRNNNLGTFWLNQLKTLNVSQKYFLLTEETYLQHFYEKNNFSRIKSVQNQDSLEWLYVTTN